MAYRLLWEAPRVTNQKRRRAVQKDIPFGSIPAEDKKTPLQQQTQLTRRLSVSRQLSVENTGLSSDATGLRDPKNPSNSILEVLKLCSPSEVLTDLTLVNRCWAEVASSSELWHSFAEELSTPFVCSEHPKLTFAKFSCIPKQTVASIFQDKVAFLKVETNDWEITSLSEEIPFSEDRAYAVLHDGWLFCCGGLHLKQNNEHNTRSDAFIIKRDGTVVRQPDMLQPRRAHGVVAFGKKVFIFGGQFCMHSHKPRNIRDNEKCYESQWAFLPTLQSDRWDFVPCVHKDLIYLCGGHNHTVETFSPDRVCFAVIPALQLPDSSESIAAMHGGCLVIKTEKHITRWDIRRKTKDICTVPDKTNGAIRGTVIGDSLYVMVLGGCRVINLQSRK